MPTDVKTDATTTTATAPAATVAPAAPKAKKFGNLGDGYYPQSGLAVFCGQSHQVNRKRKPNRAAVTALKTHLKACTDRETGVPSTEVFLSGIDDTIATLMRVRLSMSKDADGKLSGIRLNGAQSEEREAQLAALADAIDQMV